MINNNYLNMVEDMVAQYKVLKSHFKWEQDMSKHLIALQHVMYKKHVTPERILQLKDQVKNETKAFSPYRNQSMFTICGLLSSQAYNASQQLSEIISYEEILKSHGFKQSTYLPFTAYVLSQIDDERSKDTLLSYASDIYQSMKKNHPLLTSGDDYTLAILLAASDQDVELVEKYYQALNILENY